MIITFISTIFSLNKNILSKYENSKIFVLDL